MYVPYSIVLAATPKMAQAWHSDDSAVVRVALSKILQLCLHLAS